MQVSPPNKPFRVALYARVSTDEQRQGQTIDSQIAELTRFADSQGWLIVGTYKDDGWSGKMLARPALDQLRDDASKGAFDAVLVNDVDRLARDVTHLGVVRRDLERQGVRVVFRKLPAENSPTQNLLINVLGSFAEFERELITDRTRRGRRHKVEVRKQFLGAVPPYGYRYIRKDRVTGREGVLQVEPAEATIVRRIFAWVDEDGFSARHAVKRLRELGLPARKGERWARSTVLRLLRNETYAGVWHYNKHESCAPRRRGSGYADSLKTSTRLRDRAEWLPLILPEALRIIPRDRWERVQRQLDRNTAFSPRNAKHFYLLSGLVRCGACSARYVGDPNHGHFGYRCWARCHRMPMIREKALDKAVWGAVEQAILKPEVIAAGVRHLEEARVKAVKESARESEAAVRALEQLKNEEERLLEAYRLGVLSPTQLGRELEGLRHRRAAVETEPSVATAPRDPGQIRRSIADYCRLAATRLKVLDPEERRRFLRLLIEEIVFEGTRVRIRGAVPITDDGGETRPERHNLLPQTPAPVFYRRGRNVASANDRLTGGVVGLLPRYLTFELEQPLPAATGAKARDRAA